MAFASFLTVFFYLSVPFVASAVMKGLSGTTATLQAGVQGAMQTAGVIAGAGLTAAGAAATFGGSAAVQAAIEGTRTAAEGAATAGRIANDLAGAGGFAPSAPVPEAAAPIFPRRRGLRPPRWGNASRTGPIPPKSPIKRNPDGFTVTDSGTGTISHHKGNIYAPYAAQAAFNSHSSKARQGPPPLPATKPE